MHAIIEKNELMKALTRVQSALERRNTIPILNNVKCDADADNNRITFSATDMDMSIQADISANVKTSGSITAPCAMLNDIVRKLNDGADVSLKTEKQRLVIDSEKSHFQLPTLPSDEFPRINDDDMNIEFVISAKNFRFILERTRFAISLEETRYYLNGIYLHTIEQNEQAFLCAVSTDGHRLAKSITPKPDGLDAIEGVIIPRKAVLEILKLLDDPEESITCQLSTTKIRVSSGSCELLSKLIDGSFPDYNKVIPQENNNMVTIDTTLFHRAVDRVATVSSEKMRAVKFSISNGLLKLHASSAEYGDADEEVVAEYEGDELEISFNAKYLTDIATQITSQKMILSLGDSMKPAIIYEQNSDESLYVVMPMRI